MFRASANAARIFEQANRRGARLTATTPLAHTHLTLSEDEIMSDLTEKLSALLRKPIRSPEDAQQAAQVADALADLLRASQRAERLLGFAPPGAPRSENASLAGKALQDAAEAVLEAAGKPLHAKEIGRRVKARGWTHARGTPSRPDQIVYQLAARLPRFPHRFKRIAPNTFALAKWDEGAADTATKPRTSLFRGPGGDVARQIGERPDEPAGAPKWRSS
jgi:site-specific DNA-cytosine methylase